MELVPYSDADMALTEALECDPEMMQELGGAVPVEDIPRIHRMRLDGVASGDTWWFKIVPAPGGAAAGTIGIWEGEWKGEPIHEVGWMVLPAFQGRGLASRALGVLLKRARVEPSIKRVHAFPGVTNAPSNALCRKFSFTRTGECDVHFRDRPLRVSHWELDVAAVGTSA